MVKNLESHVGVLLNIEGEVLIVPSWILASLLRNLSLLPLTAKSDDDIGVLNR